MSGISILFFGKQGDTFTMDAIDFLNTRSQRVEVYTGTRHDPFPVLPSQKTWDLIISYLSPWIMPAWLLAKASQGAINFHPGPPEYPGIGCTNFAIYNDEKEFGVTCHHMVPQVDQGSIIAVSRFPLEATDTVYSLTQCCYTHIFALFVQVMGDVLTGKDLPSSSLQWARLPYKRIELDALCKIKQGMGTDEIKRRVRATSYPGMPGAYIMLGGEKFLSEKSIKCKD